MQEFYTILSNIVIILLVQAAILFSYCLRSTKNSFEWKCFFQTNKSRFLACTGLSIAISILIVISPDADSLLRIIGFDASKTPISIGIALGALAVAGLSGNKTK